MSITQILLLVSMLLILFPADANPIWRRDWKSNGEAAINDTTNNHNTPRSTTLDPNSPEVGNHTLKLAPGTGAVQTFNGSDVGGLDIISTTADGTFELHIELTDHTYHANTFYTLDFVYGTNSSSFRGGDWFVEFGTVSESGTFTALPTPSPLGKSSFSSGPYFHGAEQNLLDDNNVQPAFGYNVGGIYRQVCFAPPASVNGEKIAFRFGVTSSDQFAGFSDMQLSTQPVSAITNTNTVTNTNDTGPGSLRKIVELASSGDTITFDAPLSEQTINLISGEILIDKSLTIDASALPDGITIDANNLSRIFRIEAGHTVTLTGMTLTNGNAITTSSSPRTQHGGAIHNSGNLRIERCLISGSTTSTADPSGGTVTSGHGGGIYHLSDTPTGRLTLINCTLNGNSTGSNNISGSGGAIYQNGGISFLTHCTISGNSTGFGTTAGGNGGGIFRFDGTQTWGNTVVAGNTTANGIGPDVLGGGSITTAGNNCIGDATASGLSASGSLLVTSPLLTSLTDNGGPTHTMALRPDSPLLDAAAFTSLTTDQRGFPRSMDGDGNSTSTPDIGAYEAQAKPSSLGLVFVGGRSGSTLLGLSSNELAGAPGFRQTFWNNLTTNYAGDDFGDFTNGPAQLRTSSGSQLPEDSILLWWQASGVWGKQNDGFNTQLNTSDKRLMGGYLDSNGIIAPSVTNLQHPSTQPFVAFANLPEELVLGGYQVVVYSDGDEAVDRVAKYWITSNRIATDLSDISSEQELAPAQFINDNANFSGTYVRATATQDDGTSTAHGNYLVFENLCEPAFILRTEEGSVPASNKRAPINALQIVRNPIIIVTTNADELNAPGTLGTGISLREALRDAAPGTGIIFAPSLNGNTITLTSGQLVLHQDVTIDASSLASGITIDANQQSRVMMVEADAIAKLVNLTITGGKTPDVTSGDATAGGGIFNEGNLTLNNCDVSNNSTGNGAGILNGGITTFGSGGDGGGIYTSLNSTLTINNSIVSSNATGSGNDIGIGIGRGGDGGDGGGIYADRDSTLTCNNSTVSSNTTGNGTNLGGDGGGIYADRDSTLTCNNSTVSSNTTGNGGFSGGDGGGIFANSNSTLTLNNSTVSNNVTGNGTGDLGGFGGGGAIFSSTLTLNNSVIAGNSTGLLSNGNPATGPDLRRTNLPFTSTGKNFIGNHSGIEHTASLAGILSGDAMLAPLGNYGGPTQTMPPIPGSPLIDAIGTTSPGGNDQRGFPRTIGSSTDIGAVEIQSNADVHSILAAAWNTDTDGDGNPFGVEFALGTNPNLADPANVNNLSTPSFDESGDPALTFHLNNNAGGYVVWKLTRSTTLLPDSFVTLYEFDGVSAPDLANGVTIESLSAPDLLKVIDGNPPAGKAFYRFEAELIP